MKNDQLEDDDWIEPTFSDEQREAFRWRTEALLNGVLRIQRMAQREEAPEVIKRNRIDLCRQAAKLIGDICGDWVKLVETDSDTPLEFAALALRIWQPVLDLNDQNDFYWEHLIDEIERLPFGDEPELLRPAQRKRGEHSQPARIAKARLSALQWTEYLKARRIAPRQYKQEIGLAFGTDWDTVRKWRQSVERIFGPEETQNYLEYAAEGYGLHFEFPDYLGNLYHYGSLYRQLAGFHQLDFEAFEAAIRGKPSR